MRIRIVGLAAAALIAFGSPAEAKGPTELMITGVGLDRPIVLDYDDGSAMGVVVTASRLFEVVLNGSGADAGGGMAVSPVPTPDLGPRLRLTWSVPFGGNGDETSRLVQHLYPYAAGGPLLYTPTGQSLYGSTTASGWSRAGAGLVDALQGAGVPTDAELRAARDVVLARWLAAAGRTRPS